MNYFELFEMPVSLSVAPHELEFKYLKVQNAYNGLPIYNEEDRISVEEKHAALYKAYCVLKDEDAIIEYVLYIRGIMEENELYEIPAGYMEEIKELSDLLNNDDVLFIEEAETKISTMEKSLYEDVQNIIENYSDATTTDAQLLLVKDYYYKKKLLKPLLERLRGMRNIAG